MSAEEWRPVLGFETKYVVSDAGRVANVARRRLLKQFVDASGYYRLGLRDADGVRRNRRVHVLVAEAFHGPRPDGFVARHLDGDSLNNRQGNLAWGTVLENAADQAAHGTHRNARKANCKYGHPFSSENTYRSTASTGRTIRQCRTCHARREAKRRALRKESV
jgi:hypothetical protein